MLDRDFLARFAHVHVNDDAQVVVGSDAAVEHADDGEPDQIGFYRRVKDVEFGEEAAGHRNADEREQEDRESGRQQRGSVAEAVVVVKR